MTDPDKKKGMRLPERKRMPQVIGKPIVENLGCMKGPQPLHFLSAGGGVHVAEEKIPEGPLARPR
ncbi:MAG: hypothetical protein IJU12_10705, partial [Clostridia bacterium]|nr:hypothetical protein [Clostridia bacterium]